MQITALIKELLYQYECVTIPQFGAFLTRAFEAKVDPSGLFFPPRKEVYFNQLLIANDGVLAHHIAQKENFSYEYSLRLVEKEVSSWKKRLQTQTIRFPGIGEIRLNKEKKIEFIPWGKVNFDLKSFGLHFFERENISEIACRMEHVIDSTVESAIDQSLGFPAKTPDGQKIPASA